MNHKDVSGYCRRARGRIATPHKFLRCDGHAVALRRRDLPLASTLHTGTGENNVGEVFVKLNPEVSVLLMHSFVKIVCQRRPIESS